MGEEDKEMLKRHAREVKARSKAKSFKSLFHRMRSEQEFRKILISLEKHNIHFQEILPSLVSKPHKVEYFPDFIIWKETVSVPLFLVECGQGNQCIISQGEVQEYVQYLRKTGQFEMVISWMIPDSFPTKILNIEEYSGLMETGTATLSFENLETFKQAIVEFMKEKAPVWPVGRLEELPTVERQESLLQILRSTIGETFRRELRKRRPSLPYKQKALEDISTKDIEGISLLVQRYFENQISERDFARYVRNLMEKSLDNED